MTLRVMERKSENERCFSPSKYGWTPHHLQRDDDRIPRAGERRSAERKSDEKKSEIERKLDFIP